MSLTLLLILIGIAAGFARGGKLRNLAQVEIRSPWLVFAGLGVQVASEIAAYMTKGGFREGGRGVVLLAVSYAFLIAFVLMNRHLPGVYFVAVGLALNLAVILANSGMPVSLSAARAAGLDLGDGYLQFEVKHRPLGPDTLLPFLGDIIPIPGLKKVISAGDVILGIGIVVLLQELLTYRGRRRMTRREEEPSTP